MKKIFQKPKTVEELYQFFTKGIYRELTSEELYESIIRRRGWNLIVDPYRDDWNLSVAFYATWKQDIASWNLNTVKYND